MRRFRVVKTFGSPLLSFCNQFDLVELLHSCSVCKGNIEAPTLHRAWPILSGAELSLEFGPTSSESASQTSGTNEYKHGTANSSSKETLGAISTAITIMTIGTITVQTATIMQITLMSLRSFW